MIVANLATAAIGADDNEVTIVDDNGEYAIPRSPKIDIARVIVQHASALFAAEAKNRANLKSVKNA